MTGTGRMGLLRGVAALMGGLMAFACAPTSLGPGAATSPAEAVVGGAAAFTRAVQPRMQEAIGAGAQVRISEPLTLEVRRPSGTLVASLDRVWDYCQRDRAGCDAAVGDFARGMAEHARADASAIEPAVASLRLVVRSAGYVAQVRAAGGQPLTEALAGDLMLVLVNDLPSSVRVMTASSIAPLGLTEAEAFAAARRNTSAALAPLDQVATKLPLPPASIATLRGDPFHESSRLADVASWAPIARGALGQLIAVAPEVGTIIYLDSAQPGAVAGLDDLAARIGRQSQRPLPPVILAWTPRGWQPYLPPAPPASGGRRT